MKSESGSYLMHYAQYFDGERLTRQPNAGKVARLRKELLHGIVGMQRNVGERPALWNEVKNCPWHLYSAEYDVEGPVCCNI